MRNSNNKFAEKLKLNHQKEKQNTVNNLEKKTETAKTENKKIIRKFKLFLNLQQNNKKSSNLMQFHRSKLLQLYTFSAIEILMKKCVRVINHQLAF